jgi:hypothetical protein
VKQVRAWGLLLLILAVAPAILTELSRALVTEVLTMLLNLIQGGGL